MENKKLTIAPAAGEACPAALFGTLTVRGLDVSGVGADTARTRLDALKEAGTARLKARHGQYERAAFVRSEPVCRYVGYYKRFKKTYPVLQQLESILLKGRGIPDAGAPVEAMFLAEVKNLLLTAGHDLDKIEGDLTVGLSAGTESCRGISGQERRLTAGDLYLSDEGGVLSSVLDGPDHRTRITDATRNVLYFVYGVDGVTEAQIRAHLEDIRACLAAVLPQAESGLAEIRR